MSTIVLGGHGQIALLLAKQLASTSPVTSVIRNKDQSAAVEKAGGKPKVFDLEHSSEQQFAELFKGYHTVVWSAGAGGKGGEERVFAVDRDAAIRAIHGAELAGVKQYITVSFLGADKFSLKGTALEQYGVAKHDADVALRNSKLDWVVLGPGSLSLDEPTGKIDYDFTTPFDFKRTVSRANVALVIVEAIKNPKAVSKRTIDFLDGATPIKEALETQPSN